MVNQLTRFLSPVCLYQGKFGLLTAAGLSDNLDSNPSYCISTIPGFHSIIIQLSEEVYNPIPQTTNS